MENTPKSVQMQEGDQVNFSDASDSEGVIYAVENTDDRTYFMGRGACRSDEGYWLALFPASAINVWEYSTLHFNIPHEQIVGVTQMPMYSRAESVVLDFKPLTAYLQFTLGPDLPPVKEVRVSTNKYISGSYKADFAAKSVAVELDAGERFREIVLKPKEGELLTPGDYKMAIFARTLPEGITMEIVTEDGRSVTKRITTELKFSLGKTRDIGVFADLISDDQFEVEDLSYEPVTNVGRILDGEFCPRILEVLWDTTYNITSGLDYYQMKVLTESNEKLDLYLLRTDKSSGLDIKVGISDETTSSAWLRQVPSAMAAHMDSPEKPVYALVNADFCDNRIPIKPRGPVHCDGKIWAPSYSIDPKFPQQALSYVGVTYDGKMVIAPSVEYASAQKNLKECTGAGVILIQDSEIMTEGYINSPGRDPRTALGYTSDNIVWILAVDGRHKGVKGMTYLEMASIFHALGCQAAVNLDGGGSTQMIVRNPQSDVLEMCNWPSDPTNGLGGRERARLNGWVIMKR